MSFSGKKTPVEAKTQSNAISPVGAGASKSKTRIPAEDGNQSGNASSPL
jgi:hypothetical protein